MKVLLTGGNGYIGSAVLERLIERGHSVDAVVRTEHAAAGVTAAGATAFVHDIRNSAWLAERLNTVDAAIHTAAPADGTNASFDDAVLDGVIAGFGSTDKPYLHTGGIWVWGESDDITESSPIDAPALVAWRDERHQRLFASGVRATVIAPGFVYGDGRGIAALLAGTPQNEDGAWLAIGTGEQHWTTVHRDDLAELYVLAVENPVEGVFVAASGHNPTVAELTAAASGGGTVVAEGFEASRARLSEAFADALFLDQQASGALARATFGWTPSRPSVLEELAVARV